MAWGAGREVRSHSTIKISKGGALDTKVDIPLQPTGKKKNGGAGIALQPGKNATVGTGQHFLKEAAARGEAMMEQIFSGRLKSKKNLCWSIGRNEEGSGSWTTNNTNKDKSRNISSLQILGTILILQSRTAHAVWSEI